MRSTHPLGTRTESVQLTPLRVIKRFARPTKKEVASFIRNLAVLTDTHIPIAEAMQSLHSGLKSEQLKSIVASIGCKVTDGMTLANSFAHFPDVFPIHIVELTRVGEETGRLADVLFRLAEREERLQRLKQQIRSALAYPALVLLVTVACTVFLLTAIVPRFADLYAGFDVPLPTPTAALVTISHAVSDYWPLIAATSILLLLAAMRGLKNGRRKTVAHGLLLRLPILGRIWKASQVSNFCQTLSLLLTSGVAVDFAVRLSARCLTNKYYTFRLESVTEKIRSGTSITSALNGTSMFPEFAVSIMTAGETSGNIADSLHHVGQYYAQEVEAISDSMASMVEPLLILFVGAILGGLLSVLYLPLFDIVNVLQ